MSKTTQLLVVLLEPPPFELSIAWNISPKGGKMCLNRFTIDEDAAFELSGIHYLKGRSEGKENSFE